MGFFDSVTNFISGEEKPSSSQSQSQSGFALLPGQIQNAYKTFGTDLTNQFGGGASDDLFSPLAQTGYETDSLNMIQNGLAPTEESLSSDIAMQMNPFDDYVINEINRNAQTQDSMLDQTMTGAGQFGSNRSILGANDIENSRLNMIGRFKQDQYNKALDNSLNRISGLKAQDIGLGFTAGDFLRNLDTQQKQAPINALSTFGQLLGALPASGGSRSSSSSVGASKEAGLTDALGSVGQLAAGIGSFSDKRLKKDIKKIGEKNGFNIYSFRYLSSPVKYIGVMAQEVAEKVPEAVSAVNGFLTVNYDKIGIKMERA